MKASYAVATYHRADLPEATLVNLYAEQAATEPGGVVLFPRPALKTYDTFPTGPVRGLFQQPGVFSGAIIAMSGDTVYSNGSPLAGAIVGTSPVQMVASDTTVLIAPGGQLYRTDNITVTSVAFPDEAAVSSVAYLGGYSIAARANSRRFYFTLYATTWDGLDYLSAAQSTDYIVGLMVVVDKLWVFCQQHTEVFFLTGDADAPFQRVEGVVFDKGAASRESIVRIDNSVVWVGNDNIVYRGESPPMRISDHSIEERIAASVSVSCYSYDWKGHKFVIVKLDGESFAYDVATKLWHEVQSTGQNPWSPSCSVRFGRETMLGSALNGVLWTLDDTLYADQNGAGVGTILRREFSMAVNTRMFLDNVTIDCAVGEADTEGFIEMKLSRDGGRTFTEWERTSLGLPGQYRKRVAFNRLGVIDQEDMILNLRFVDAVPTRVSNIRINETNASRSR